MTRILLYTLIQAPIALCFDLARDTSVHLQSTAQTKERVVAGRREGLFESGDEVTWEAVHLGVRQRLSTKITRMEPPLFFEDTMQKGAFKNMRHEHHFSEEDGITTMTDIFEYEVPLGRAGRLFDRLYLEKYMRNLLLLRNAAIKNLAEKDNTTGSLESRSSK